ncbi:AAA family ATPase [Ideonella sp.]|uniref:AAA family ATPase n=1 Tax=Ideonella sp. TaxID=1929293 RepID=UPI003BB64004
MSASDGQACFEAEQSVIAGLLTYPQARARVDIRAEEFADRTHRLVIGAIDRLIAAGQEIDPITVFAELSEAGEADGVGGVSALAALIDSVPLQQSIPAHANIVRKAAETRKAMQVRRQASTLLRDPDAPLADVQELLAQLGEQPVEAESPRFSLMGVHQLRELPPVRWRIHSLLPAVGVAAVFGPSGAGKSFLQLDMMAAGCIGGRWFGHLVKPGRWLYVALEGQAAFRQRVEAWEHHHDTAFPEQARFLFDAFKLTNGGDVLALASAIDAAGGADVVVIDTLNRAAPEADENSSADMGLILEGVRSLQSMTGGLIVLVHHAGKDATKGMRGHSSLYAALDAVISVTRDNDRREWSVSKAKDGEDGATHSFRLERVTLGTDEDGEQITSCVVLPDLEAQLAPPRPKLPKGGNQKIVYDALGPLFRESNCFGRAGASPVRPCLRLDDVMDKVKERLPVEAKRQAERVKQAITGLVAAGVLCTNEGWIWLK